MSAKIHHNLCKINEFSGGSSRLPAESLHNGRNHFFGICAETPDKRHYSDTTSAQSV